MNLQLTLDGEQTYKVVPYKDMKIEDLKVLVKNYEEDNARSLSDLESAILFGSIPTKPAIIDSREIDTPDECLDGIEWQIPGHKEASRYDGWYTRVIADSGGHSQKPIKQRCMKLSCPVCCWDAINEKAITATNKVWAVRQLNHPELFDRERVLQHIVISVPEREWEEIYTEEGFDRLRTQAMRIVSEIGIVGGVAVFHPFRRNGVDDDKVGTEYIPTDSNNMDTMSWRLGPHFHVIGYGFVQQNSIAWMSSHGGWLFKAIRTGKDKIVTKKQLYGTIRYVISHCGVCDGARKQAINYVGELNSKNTCIVGTGYATKPLKCTICGMECRELILNYQDRTITDNGPALQKRKYSIYTTRARLEESLHTITEYRDKVGVMLSELSETNSGFVDLPIKEYRNMKLNGWTFTIRPNYKDKGTA